MVRSLSNRLRALCLFLVIVLGAAAGAQVFPDDGATNEGTPVSGGLASLYAVDGNPLVLSTATEASSGYQVASFTASFAIPAGRPSALLHAVTGTNLSGCTVQAYVYDASASDYLGYRAAASGSGVVEFALSGDQLNRYRDASTGETRIELRVFRPASAGSGTVTWSTDQLAVLLPILPDGGSDNEGTYVSGTLTSLFAIDGDAYVKTTLPDENGVPVASIRASFRIPDGAPSAILHAAAGTDLAGSILQGYVAPDTGDHYLGYAPFGAALSLVDFPLTSTDVARRDPNTGELLVALRMFRPPSAGSGTVTWSVDGLVMYAAPSPGPALPTALAATAVSASEIDLAWTDNANNETGYLIERKTGASGTYAQVGTASANATAYADTGLAASTAYVYRVRAMNSSGNSPYGNEASATTQMPQVDPPPRVYAVASGTDSIRVYWAPVPYATSYKIYRATSSGNQGGQPIGVAAGSATTFDDTGLTTNQNYYYVVTSVVSGVESGRSEESYHFPSAGALPLAGSPYALMSAVVSKVNSTGDPDSETGMAYVPAGNSTLVLPDESRVDDTTYSFQSNPDSWADWTNAYVGGQNVPTAGNTANVADQLGSIYRVTTTATNLIGCEGVFELPMASTTNTTADAYVRKPGIVVENESTNAYIGLTAPSIGLEVDAGLNLNPQNSSGYPLRWAPVLRVSEQHADHPPMANGTWVRRAVGNRFDKPFLTSTSQYGAQAKLTFRYDINSKLVTLVVEGGTADNARQIVTSESMICEMRFTYENSNAVLPARMKRLITIAQSSPKAGANRVTINPGMNGSRYYYPSGAHFNNVGWQVSEGKILNAQGNWVLWGAVSQERTSGLSVAPTTTGGYEWMSLHL